MSHAQNIVQTNLGVLQGKVNIASDGQEYYAFHGVPFAQPPIGELRFKAPKPVQPWCGILDATVEGSECVSHDLITQQRIGSENCLNLNVYTHSITPGVKKPVMVFIHGGLFVGGSNKTEQYGPDFFMCEDVVLVIPNYRLGIFGFLALHDKSLGVPGNAGLKDQVMALRWVQENIEFFGGNPNNVTLFGGSAGGASVNYLQCSPMAVGLFHKVIIQSGCASAHWAGGQIHPIQIDTHLKMEGKSEKELLDKMMTLNEEELFAVQYACKFSKRVTDERPLGPVIEGFNPYEPSFLVEDPVKIFESGNYINVPMILGYNSKEGIMVEVANGKKFRLLSNFDITVPYKYGFERYGNTWKSVGNKIKTFYHGADNPVLMSSVDNFRNV